MYLSVCVFFTRRLAREDPNVLLKRVAENETLPMSVITMAVKNFIKFTGKTIGQQVSQLSFTRRVAMFRARNAGAELTPALATANELQENYTKMKEEFSAVANDLSEWDATNAKSHVSSLFVKVTSIEEHITSMKAHHTLLIDLAAKTNKDIASRRRSNEKLDFKTTTGFGTTGLTPAMRSVYIALQFHDQWDDEAYKYQQFNAHASVKLNVKSPKNSDLTSHLLWDADNEVPLGGNDCFQL